MTENGPVKGERRNNTLEPCEAYLAFHAIPYAAPPIKELRFKPPTAHANWSGTYDASISDHKDKCCPQVMH